jgi:hypothetical protein
MRLPLVPGSNEQSGLLIDLSRISAGESESTSRAILSREALPVTIFLPACVFLRRSARTGAADTGFFDSRDVMNGPPDASVFPSIRLWFGRRVLGRNVHNGFAELVHVAVHFARAL